MAGSWYLLSSSSSWSPSVPFQIWLWLPPFNAVCFQAEWDCGKELLQSQETVSEADASDWTQSWELLSSPQSHLGAHFLAFWVAFIMVFDWHLLPQCHTAWWQLSFCHTVTSCFLQVFRERAGAVGYFNRGSWGHGDILPWCLQGRALWLLLVLGWGQDCTFAYHCLCCIKELVSIVYKTQWAPLLIATSHPYLCTPLPRAHIHPCSGICIYGVWGNPWNYLYMVGQLLTSLKAKSLDISKVLQSQIKSRTSSWRYWENFILFLPCLDP